MSNLNQCCNKGRIISIIPRPLYTVENVLSLPAKNGVDIMDDPFLQERKRTVRVLIKIIINKIHCILNLDKTVIRNNYPNLLVRHSLVSGCPRNEKMLN